MYRPCRGWGGEGDDDDEINAHCMICNSWWRPCWGEWWHTPQSSRNSAIFTSLFEQLFIIFRKWNEKQLSEFTINEKSNTKTDSFVLSTIEIDTTACRRVRWYTEDWIETANYSPAHLIQMYVLLRLNWTINSPLEDNVPWKFHKKRMWLWCDVRRRRRRLSWWRRWWAAGVKIEINSTQTSINPAFTTFDGRYNSFLNFCYIHNNFYSNIIYVVLPAVCIT